VFLGLLYPDSQALYDCNADPDPAFHINMDPDPALHQSDGNLRQLVFNPSTAVLQIREILVRIRASDPDPDPAVFVIDLQDANKKQFFLFITS
jgi:hypothetical protein